MAGSIFEPRPCAENKNCLFFEYLQMILVPFFASSTLYGSTINLLSLPFQAPLFFGLLTFLGQIRKNKSAIRQAHNSRVVNLRVWRKADFLRRKTFISKLVKQGNMNFVLVQFRCSNFLNRKKKLFKLALKVLPYYYHH